MNDGEGEVDLQVSRRCLAGPHSQTDTHLYAALIATADDMPLPLAFSALIWTLTTIYSSDS